LVASRHGGSGLITPLATDTPERAAVCVYCTMWSKAEPQNASAYGLATSLKYCWQSLPSTRRSAYSSSVS
jgi:hypothetical protein